MPVDLLEQFYTNIEKFDDFTYLLSILRYNLAPVIHKNKISGLINLINRDRKTKDIWMTHKEEIGKIIDLKYFELRESEDSILILFYRPHKLKSRLRDQKVKAFLGKLGYNDCVELYEYLIVLQKKFTTSCPFEVGVFLGYPLSDIIAFNSDSRNFKCLGYWKCFFNVAKAKRTFRVYDNAKICEIVNILQEA